MRSARPRLCERDASARAREQHLCRSHESGQDSGIRPDSSPASNQSGSIAVKTPIPTIWPLAKEPTFSDTIDVDDPRDGYVTKLRKRFVRARRVLGVALERGPNDREALSRGTALTMKDAWSNSADESHARRSDEMPMTSARRARSSVLLGILPLVLTACDFGPVVAVHMRPPLACSPLILGDSMHVYVEADRDRFPVVAYSSSRRPESFAWTSSASAVAGVSALGLVRAKTTGAAWIGASAEGFRDSLLLRVARSDTTVTIVPRDPVLNVGDTLELRAPARTGTGTEFLAAWLRLSVGDDARVVYVVESQADRVRITGMGRGTADLTWSAAGRCGVLRIVVR